MRVAYLIEPPFNYRTESGAVTGCDVEVAREVMKRLGLTDIQFIETEFAELLPGLRDGRWEMTTGLFATDERQLSASFSRPIWALPDGLLVRHGNPLGLSGYRSIAAIDTCRLAVIRDQFQHRSALDFGVPHQRISIHETYTEAAKAVAEGHVDAYASVARAHSGFIERHQDMMLAMTTVPSSEKRAAFGSFGFARDNDDLRLSVDDVLKSFIGSTEHRAMVSTFGFSSADVDLVAS